MNALKRISNNTIRLLLVLIIAFAMSQHEVCAAAPPYVPVTIINRQTSAVTAGTQVRIKFNPSSYSSYLRSNLGNIRFYRASDWLDANRMYAWNENGTTTAQTNVVFWLKLTDPVPANNSLMVYMTFYSTNTDYDGVFWGQAPQLSATYGQYDNGLNVFNFYDNFAGTSLNSTKYRTNLFANDHCSIMPSVNNGLTINADKSCNAGLISTSSFLLSAYTVDSYSYWSQVGLGHSNGAGWNKGAHIDDYGIAIEIGNRETTGALYTLAGGGGAQDFSGPSSSSPNLFSITLDSTTTYGYWNYNQVASASNGGYSGESFNVAAAHSSDGLTYTQWVRVRVTPPNIVNPSSCLGAVTVMDTTGGTSGTNVQGPGWTYAFPITIMQSGTLQSIGVNWGDSSPGSVIVALYSAGSNKPASLLVQSSSVAITTSPGWQDIPISAYSITAGNYWLAVQISASKTVNIQSSSESYYSKTYGSFDSTWGARSGLQSDGSQWNMRVIYTIGLLPSDFILTASTTSQTVSAGNTASYSLNVQYSSTLTAPVNLAVTSGCPTGVTCTLSSTSVTGSALVTLSVPTLITTQGGITPVTVSASSTLQSLSHSITIQLIVNPAITMPVTVREDAAQVIVTVSWAGPGTAPVTLAGPGGSPILSESAAIVYDRTLIPTGASTSTYLHRVTFTLIPPPSSTQTWNVLISPSLSSSYTVTIEVN